MSMTPKIIVAKGRERPFLGRHPWLFSGAIARIEGEPADGSEVTVHGNDGRFLARGLYNSRSQIRVRLYTWVESEALDADFWRGRILDALRLRRDVLNLGDQDESACRLIFSESDGMSGLTVDRYGPYLAVQFTSLALALRREEIVTILAEAVRPRGMILRTEKGVGDAEGLTLRDGPLWGSAPESPILVAEHDCTFEVDIRTGQKTGFYLDQRENRRLVRGYARGRRSLDLFCYTGAFALNLSRAGSARVTAVDVSAPAMETARRNAALNGINNIELIVMDAFSYLEECVARGDLFDLIVLDPPRFTHGQRTVDQALKGYGRLNSLALNLLAKDGILVTCSCSGRVSRDDFIGVVAAASERTERPVQLLSMTGQAPDHPVSSACPETEYLKCFICRVP
jgi:23S rRNA (cytosine1962-C5)-methyltransferase